MYIYIIYCSITCPLIKAYVNYSLKTNHNLLDVSEAHKQQLFQSDNDTASTAIIV